MSGAGDAPLMAKLRERIRSEGPISLGVYMEICLADPEHGYYRKADPIGAAGDFTTSPEISQIFGELIGLALAQAWLDQGQPPSFLLVELGPGRGRLMADAIRAVRRVPGFLDAAQPILVETSAPLRTAQAKALGGAPREPLWLDRLEDATDGPVFLIANEFFDAMPLRQWRRAAEGWRERRIALGADDALVYEFGPPEPLDVPDLSGAPIGAWFERSEASEAIVDEIGKRLSARGGAALAIDYAYDLAQRRAAGWPETFQAVRAHAYADPLEAPGAADLTAHVDFSALSAAAARQGAQAHGPVTQGAFLRRLGAEQRAAALAKANPSQAESVAAGLGRLIDPREMGALFKVLGLTAKGAPPIAGFA